jgi:hypothetical protein
MTQGLAEARIPEGLILRGDAQRRGSKEGPKGDDAFFAFCAPRSVPIGKLRTGFRVGFAAAQNEPLIGNRRGEKVAQRSS